MAEFSEIMHDWERMCRSYGNSCADCPLERRGIARCTIYDFGNSEADWSAIPRIVNDWAEEHPEPEFPTWYDYLCNIGVLNGCGTSAEVLAALTELHIAPAIAERLGLSPE